MANATSGISAQHAAQAVQAYQTTATPSAKQAASNKPGAPKDSVTISCAGRAASQAQPATQQSPTNSDHGDK